MTIKFHFKSTILYSDNIAQFQTNNSPREVKIKFHFKPTSSTNCDNKDPLETNNSPQTVKIKFHFKPTVLHKLWQWSSIWNQPFSTDFCRQWACSTCTSCSPAVCDVIFFLGQTSSNDKAPAVQWQWTIWDDFTHESPKLDNTSQNKGLF